LGCCIVAIGDASPNEIPAADRDRTRRPLSVQLCLRPLWAKPTRGEENHEPRLCCPWRLGSILNEEHHGHHCPRSSPPSQPSASLARGLCEVSGVTFAAIGFWWAPSAPRTAELDLLGEPGSCWPAPLGEYGVSRDGARRGSGRLVVLVGVPGQAGLVGDGVQRALLTMDQGGPAFGQLLRAHRAIAEGLLTCEDTGTRTQVLGAFRLKRLIRGPRAHAPRASGSRQWLAPRG
jgi:hypothetical protein